MFIYVQIKNMHNKRVAEGLLMGLQDIIQRAVEAVELPNG